MSSYGEARYGPDWRGPKDALETREYREVGLSHWTELDEFMGEVRSAVCDLADVEVQPSYDGFDNPTVYLRGWRAAATDDILQADHARFLRLSRAADVKTAEVARARETLMRLAPDLLKADWSETGFIAPVQDA